tara:strand:+ start:463 stop:648 length:186 start_codon:yes stop_codon:yes gene_type:complete
MVKAIMQSKKSNQGVLKMTNEEVLERIKSWLEANVESEIHEKDLVQDSKDLLKYIDIWENE